MDISKLQDCNSSGSVYQFSVSSKSAVEKIVGSDNTGQKTFTFVSQKLLALIILKINPRTPTNQMKISYILLMTQRGTGYQQTRYQMNFEVRSIKKVYNCSKINLMLNFNPRIMSAFFQVTLRFVPSKIKGKQALPLCLLFDRET